MLTQNNGSDNPPKAVANSRQVGRVSPRTKLMQPLGTFGGHSSRNVVRAKPQISIDVPDPKYAGRNFPVRSARPNSDLKPNLALLGHSNPFGGHSKQMSKSPTHAKPPTAGKRSPKAAAGGQRVAFKAQPTTPVGTSVKKVAAGQIARKNN